MVATMEATNGTAPQTATIEDKGLFNWNEIHKLKPTPTGVKMAAVNSEMWGKIGFTITRTDERNLRKFSIKYDKDFVADNFHRLFVALGIYKDGKINEKLLKEVVDYSVEYSLKEGEREKAAELARMAEPIMLEKNLTQEEAEKYLQDLMAWQASYFEQKGK